MVKIVLSIGNCSLDHAVIQRTIEEHFDAEVLCAADITEAFQVLHSRPVDLVLVNRQLHRDFTDGIEVIRRLKGELSLALHHPPILLLSDRPDSQEQAVSVGAEPGFGKSQLRGAAISERLGKYLGSKSSPK